MKTPIKNIRLGVNGELKGAIEASMKDFKATLFIQNMEMEEIERDYEVYEIELDLESKPE